MNGRGIWNCRSSGNRVAAIEDEQRITQALRRRGTTMLCPACQFVLRGPVGTYRLVPEDAAALGGAKGIKVTVYG